jgi:hypothetical protein
MVTGSIQIGERKDASLPLIEVKNVKKPYVTSDLDPALFLETPTKSFLILVLSLPRECRIKF